MATFLSVLCAASSSNQEINTLGRHIQSVSRTQPFDLISCAQTLASEVVIFPSLFLSALSLLPTSRSMVNHHATEV